MRIEWNLLVVSLVLMLPMANAGEFTPLPGLEEALAGGQPEEKLKELGYTVEEPD